MNVPATGGGYSQPGYARALAEFGRPRFLPSSGGWILERAIPGEDERDAMGAYPIFTCRDWSGLATDCESLAGELVSLTIVADPFGNHSEGSLRHSFPDLVRPFKTHFVADLHESRRDFVSRHHQYYARKALSRVGAELCLDPPSLLDEWCFLYHHLVSRHELTGVKAFSKRSFEQQLALPGMVAFRAIHEGQTVAAHLWLVEGDVAYSHLAAAHSAGYELMAAYALHSKALEHFQGRVRYLDWGGGAGDAAKESDGLVRFKSGWANQTRTSFLCGRILHPNEYRRLCAEKNIRAATYFPAYRAGELI